MVTAITPMQAAAITGARNWDDVRRRHPAHVDQMAQGLMRGDPLADAVVAEYVAARGTDGALSWEQTIGALDAPAPTDPAADTIALPRALRAFIDAASRRPDWFDASLARAGATAWWRFGSLQSSTLYQSLIYGYQARGFTRPLVETGRLTTGTYDRLFATARWVALATAPDMMTPGHPGWTETLRIRLVHAMVRHHLLTRTDWDVEQWGHPINQTYSQFTITAGFLALPLRVAHDLGLRYSRAELEAITHLWRWIGWVMGVDDDLLPRDYADAQLIEELARGFQMEPDPHARTLVSALFDEGFRAGIPLSSLPKPIESAVNGAVDTLTRPMLRTLFAAVSARWVGGDVARSLGLRPSPLQHVVVLARPIVRSREVLRALGVLGSDTEMARRELALVTAQLGLDLANPDMAGRYRDVA